MTSRMVRLTSALRALVWGALLLLLVLPSLNWLLPATDGGGAAATRLLGWGLAMPPFAAVAVGLWFLLGFCRRAGSPDVFTGAAARAIRRFGWALVTAGVLFPLSRLAIALTLGAPAGGHGALPGLTVIVLGSAVGGIVGLVFVVVAAIIDEGTRLAEENASFL